MKGNSKNKIEEEVANPIDEIGTIREILMGNHIRKFDETFEAIRAELAKSNSDIDGRMSTMLSDLNTRIDDMDKRINKRLDAIEANLEKTTLELNEKIELSSKNHKQKLSQLFNVLSNQITSD